jgi:hypothetical protein
MSASFGRLWGRRDADGTHGDVAPASPAPDAGPDPDAGPMLDDAVSPIASDADQIVDAAGPHSLCEPEADVGAPEQPVLLTPVGTTRQVHVGDVLPPARRGWAGGLVRLPPVPKRAILAAGVCAGLVAPALARHLAIRLLLGPGAKSGIGSAGTLEVTRIVYHGPVTAETISSIVKALTAGRH